MRYAADMDALAIIACGSAQAMATAYASSSGGLPPQSMLSGAAWPWGNDPEDDFLRDE